MPEITVIIPCFNYGRYLDEAVDSVLAQTFQDFDVVVVDDGSDETDTRALLDGYQRPKVRVLRTENRGVAAARNAGREASESRYVCHLDADDRLRPRYLEATRARLHADSDQRLGFVTTWLRKFGNETEAWKSRDYSPLELAVTCNVHTASLVRRRALEAVDGYRESFPSGEDWNLWVNLVAAGYEWEVVEEELFLYRRHGPSQSHRSLRNRQSLFEAIVRDNADFYRDHHTELLALLFQKAVALETVWLEKDQALEDNQELLGLLTTEQQARQQAIAAYRELESYCQTLVEVEQSKSVHLDQLTGAYRRLEAHCHALEARLRETDGPAAGRPASAAADEEAGGHPE